MKKLLALILSVVMLLSVMPVAYAERATFSSEVELCIDSFINAYSFAMSRYETAEQQDEVEAIFENALDKELEIFNGKDIFQIVHTGSLDDIQLLTEVYQNAVEVVEEKISNGELVIVINAYKLAKLDLDIQFYYEYNEWQNLKLVSRKYNEQYWNEYNNAYDQMEMAYALSQAEFDAAVDKLISLYSLFINCLDGVHNYGEYISNNDATEEADGTKTAVCEICGATDTVVDEGSKLVREPASFFEMLIAFIKAFFEKIFSIFG